MRRDRSHPITVEHIPDFWERLSNAPSAFLALDYDGTLAPFHVDRMRATPLTDIPELLDRINTRTQGALAIVSGRTMAELETLLPMANLTLIGSHGFEIKRPGAALVRREPRLLQNHGLALARMAAEDTGAGRLLEIKPGSVALHTRGLSRLEAQHHESQVGRLWTGLAPAHDLEVTRFEGGIELRSLGFHKGDAVRELMVGLRDGALVAYIGDDETDEDVFRLLRSKGYGIRVGPVERPTMAQGRLKDIADVREFLACWHDLAPMGAREGDRTWISGD